MSSLAWIDFDEAERKRAEQILALFEERDSRDELGLGAIRDSIADHLFPGTSTIQTRLRYMFFVPWLFRQLEGRDIPERQLPTEARALEVRLIDALRAGGESNGVIGIDAGPRLQRLPSSIYWAGLGTWGIRFFLGSIESLFVCLRGTKRLRISWDSEDAAAGPRIDPIWHPSLPPPPKDLLDRAGFRLTADEAEFIIDRLVATQPKAVLTLLARERDDAECDHIWAHPHLASFLPEMRRLVRHAEIFSQVMHGAALLYNLALSELRDRDDWVANYRGRIETWAAELDLSVVHAWSLEDFWKAVEHPAHNIRPAAQLFVMRWRELVLEGAAKIASVPAARQLVEQRERQLKTNLSRYTNQAVRDRWTGASGAERLSFRWTQAKSHLKDLADAR